MQRNFQPILTESIHQYTVIHNLLLMINKEISTATPERLDALNASLVDIQKKAVELDSLIQEELKSPAMLDQQTQSLARTREELVASIIELNKEITVRAVNVKSLLAHEIRTLKNGHSAISGYRTQQEPQGRLVNRAL